MHTGKWCQTVCIMRWGQNNDLAISKVHTMVTLWVGDEWCSFTYTAESAVGLCVQHSVVCCQRTSGCWLNLPYLRHSQHCCIIEPGVINPYWLTPTVSRSTIKRLLPSPCCENKHPLPQVTAEFRPPPQFVNGERSWQGEHVLFPFNK